MKINIISFTRSGCLLNKKVRDGLNKIGYSCSSYTTEKYYKEFQLHKMEGTIVDWSKNFFTKVDAFIFIGACGIAVRAISPSVKSKITDPAVIVMDEKEQFIISLLSGHIGGGNDLVNDIGTFTDAIKVITTATDLNNKFSVDMFAKKNNLYISSMPLAKKVSSEILDGKTISLYSEFPLRGKIPSEISPSQKEDLGIVISLDKRKKFKETLSLIPKIVTIGIGCRKNSDFLKIENQVLKVLEENNISINGVKKVASIDLKEKEKGIIEFCNKYEIPFVTYSSKELSRALGKFTESDFVKRITGVGNVCERAAVLNNKKGKLILKKKAEDGVTLALYIEDWSGKFE